MINHASSERLIKSICASGDIGDIHKTYCSSKSEESVLGGYESIDLI